LEGVTFKILPRRTCVLSFTYEGASGAWETSELRFDEVAAFKCTFQPALTAEMIESAYDKLVDMGSSSWLDEANRARVPEGAGTVLRHLRICFDDGPCYEFLCPRFELRKE
jgi:hypothetical protein